MINLKLIFYCVFISVTISIQSKAQNMNISETINYINTKLEILKPRENINQNSFVVEIENNKLIINERFYMPGNKSYYSEKSTVEISEIEVNPCSYNVERGILFSCLNKVKCWTVETRFDSYTWPNPNKPNPYIQSEASVGIWGIQTSDKESLCNAFSHLFKLVIDKEAKAEKPYDPFASKATSSVTTSNVIKMKKMAGGTYEIPVELNGVLKINFIFDSGASDLSVSPDVALTLKRTGTIQETDYIGKQTYVFADGSKASSTVFIIRKMEIGGHVITNVRASISNSIDAPMLLGQSVLEKFGKITIDNVNQTLTIQK